jgi:hypothetical protein
LFPINPLNHLSDPLHMAMLLARIQAPLPPKLTDPTADKKLPLELEEEASASSSSIMAG